MRKDIDKFRFWEFITIDFYSQWSSLIFWEKMNWRDFTFMNFKIEYADYAERFVLDLWLLGLGLCFTWHESCYKKRKEELEKFYVNVLKIKREDLK